MQTHIAGPASLISLSLFVGADGSINEYDVFRNTALNYLCLTYSLYRDTAQDRDLRLCVGK